MSNKQAVIIEKVKQWISYAEEDLLTAEHALTLMSSAPFRIIAYHAQQCAEKYLKAYLVFHLIDFPYTHNIRQLLQLCSTKSDWADELEETQELTAYAITTRYPGRPMVTLENAQQAIEMAKQVKSEVLKALKNEKFMASE